MTYTVDPEALRAVARRFDTEAGEVQAHVRRVATPDAGGTAGLVDLVLTDLEVRSRTIATTLGALAVSLRVNAALGVEVDGLVADRLVLPWLEEAPWSS